jgi:uncharacterized protein YcbK (DUF882 family)
MRGLRAAIVVACLFATRSVHAEDSAAGSATVAPPLAKKDRYLADKLGAANDDAGAAARAAWRRQLDARIGKQPSELVNIYNTHTKEYLAVPRAPRADSVPQYIGDRFFRCHFTNQPTDMDPELLGLVVEAARRFRAARVNIVSGFRSPKYNLILRKKGREVARDSQHTYGHAVDFRIPGVPIDRLYLWVRSRRLGGVGVYRTSGFVHADTWRVRYWTGR